MKLTGGAHVNTWLLALEYGIVLLNQPVSAAIGWKPPLRDPDWTATGCIEYPLLLLL